MGDANINSKTEKEIEIAETEKKIEIAEKTEKTAKFIKLREELFNEAEQLVTDDPSSRIAIFLSPSPGSADISLHTFGYPSIKSLHTSPHPSVEGDLKKILEEEEEVKSPPRTRGRFWWEDPKLMESTNLEELVLVRERMMKTRDRLVARIVESQRGQSSVGNNEDSHNEQKPDAV